jgi:hypothetical protein
MHKRGGLKRQKYICQRLPAKPFERACHVGLENTLAPPGIYAAFSFSLSGETSALIG